jgi:hypothetical protein
LRLFEHQGEYDLILEQTFCALPPTIRHAKMHQLLVKDGILAGVLFDRYFESDSFGGSQNEYNLLLKRHLIA